MTAKSVIDVDINDAAFRRFAELFARYDAALSKQPDIWKKVAAAQKGGAGGSFQTQTAALLAQTHAFKEQGTQLGKTGKELQHQESLWTKIHKSTTGVVKDMSEASKWLVKMGVGLGLGALGTGIAGLFGLMALGRDVGTLRMSALQTSTSPGQVSAWQTWTQRLLPGGGMQFLQGVQQAETPGPYQAFASMLRPYGATVTGDVFQDAVNMLKAVQAFTKANKGQLANLPAMYGTMLSQYGLGSTAALAPFGNLSTSELGNVIKQMVASVPGQEPQNPAAWNDFTARLETVFKKIKTDFENMISSSGLLRPIERFMGTFEKDLKILLSGGVAKTALANLGTALDNFTQYMASGQFTQALQRFSNDVHDFGVFVDIYTWPTRMAYRGVKGMVKAGVGSYDWLNKEFEQDIASHVSLTAPFIRFGYPDPLKNAVNSGVRGGVQQIMVNMAPLPPLRVQIIAGPDFTARVVNGLTTGGP